MYGIPQGSVLGPLQHGVSFHCYADDTQPYISSQPDKTYQFEKLTECIVDIKKTVWLVISYC